MTFLPESEYLRTTGDRPFIDEARTFSIAQRGEAIGQDVPRVTVAEAIMFAREEGQQVFLTDEGVEAIFVDGVLVRLDQPEEGWDATAPAPVDTGPPNEPTEDPDLVNAPPEDFTYPDAGTIVTAPDGTQYVFLEDGTTRSL